MLDDICSIMEPECHADPQLRTTLSYTNMTASSVLKALIEKGWTKEQLPGLRTISDILNRQGYRLRSVEKTKVQKKRAFTDQIFENVRSVNAEANSAPDAIRISLDTKATIKIGDFSRGGKSRGLKAVQAADHDMIITTKLTPGWFQWDRRLMIDYERKISTAENMVYIASIGKMLRRYK